MPKLIKIECKSLPALPSCLFVSPFSNNICCSLSLWLAQMFERVTWSAAYKRKLEYTEVNQMQDANRECSRPACGRSFWYNRGKYSNEKPKGNLFWTCWWFSWKTRWRENRTDLSLSLPVGKRRIAFCWLIYLSLYSYVIHLFFSLSPGLYDRWTSIFANALPERHLHESARRSNKSSVCWAMNFSKGSFNASGSFPRTAGQNSRLDWTAWNSLRFH